MQTRYKVQRHFCVDGGKLRTTKVGCKDSELEDTLLHCEGRGGGGHKRERIRTNWKGEKVGKRGYIGERGGMTQKRACAKSVTCLEG